MKEVNKMKHKKENRLKTAFFLNFIFSIIEVVGGFLTNSVALFSDAIHDLGDSLSLGLSWFLNEKSKKKPDQNYTYGYARYSLLGGLISSLVLLIGSTILVIEAIPRLLSPEPVNVPWLFGFAILGIIINGIAALKTSKGHSLNEKMVSLHLLEDVGGWAILLVSSIVMMIWTVPILDPILSIGFTLYILSHVYRNLKAIFEIFLERSPKNINLNELREALINHELIKDIHHIHIWTLEGQLTLLTMHVQMESSASKEKVTDTQKWIHETLLSFGIHHSTVEIECFQPCETVDCDPGASIDEPHHHHHH